MRCLCLVALFLLAANCRGADDPMLLLPASARHTFAPIDPKWQKVVSYLKFEGTSFVGVNNPSLKDKRALYKDVRYFPEKTKGANATVKIVTSYPNGVIYREIDNVIRDGASETFCERYFPSGEPSEYTYMSNGKWLAGWAIDPQNRQANSFADGKGWLTSYKGEPGSYTKTWYSQGNAILEAKYQDGQRREVQLEVGSDMMIVSDQGERLSLRSECESWNTPTGSPPSLQIVTVAINASTGDLIHLNVPPKTDVRPMPRSGMFRPETSAEKKEKESIAKEWAIAYPKRRATFLERFRKLADGTDKVLAEQGIDLSPPQP